MSHKSVLPLCCCRSMVGHSTPAVLAAAPFKWATVLGAQPAVPHLLEEFAADAVAEAAPVAAAAAGAAGGRFAGLSADARRQQLMSEVSSVITTLLGTGEYICHLACQASLVCSM